MLCRASIAEPFQVFRFGWWFWFRVGEDLVEKGSS